MIYLLPICVAIGSIPVVLIRRRRRSRQWLVATMATVFALYLSELLCLAIDVDPRIRQAWLQREPFDRRTREEVVNELRRRGIDAQPNVLPAAFVTGPGLRDGDERILPLSGVAGTTVVFCNEAGSYVTFVSDEEGFNNPAGSHRLRRADVVLIGDSYAQGQCVRRGEDVASRLRGEGLDALTLGVSGNGPLAELATLVEYAAPLQPRWVVWCYFGGNDLGDLRRELQSETLVRYLEPGFHQDLRSRRPTLDAELRRYIDQQLKAAISFPSRTPAPPAWAEFLRLGHLEQRVVRGGDGPAPRPEGNPSLDSALALVLVEAKHRVEGWGGRFLVLSLPEWQGGRPRPMRPRLRERLVAKGISIVDSAPRFALHPDPRSLFPLRIIGHYNPEGYRILTEEILTRIGRGPNGTVPATPPSIP